MERLVWSEHSKRVSDVRRPFHHAWRRSACGEWRSSTGKIRRRKDEKRRCHWKKWKSTRSGGCAGKATPQAVAGQDELDTNDDRAAIGSVAAESDVRLVYLEGKCWCSDLHSRSGIEGGEPNRQQRRDWPSTWRRVPAYNGSQDTWQRPREPSSRG